ncbi:hypothetical protein H4218_005497 [Coemansia sp. IMI 209128]|nr:hypothetical protein GGI10_001990 [Coemansia sp. RSA 2530]KAJ2694710.1 hypothetical protein H4218_005497 [Coemansia sp. IMI 209128]
MTIAVGSPVPPGPIQVFLSPNSDSTPGVPGPDRVLSGFVVVAGSALAGAEQVEVQYRGVEVVGGTLDDFDDIETLVPRKGMRALTKVYFDERLVLWRRETSSFDGESGEYLRLPFSIALPRANYPAEIKSVCKPAPSQSFEIAYHVVGWVHPPAEGEPLRYVCPVSYVPLLARPPGIVPQAPVIRTAYDDRGKECLVTRVTLSQSDYVPGDQVVGGVYIECTKTNRSIRKAECQLRQRIECRMRRTYSSAAETAAERSAASSRPQSSQKSAESDDSDILWTRVVDLGPWRPLTLTTVGLGLAASAAAASSTGGFANGSGNSSASLVSDLAGSSGLDSSATKTLSKGAAAIMTAPNRSCSANVHTDIPATTPLVPGHFLSFSYELLVSVTVYSLTRGSQALTTRTPLGGSNSSQEPATPVGQIGSGAFTLSRHHRLLAAEPLSLGSGSLSASAACFPPNVLQPPSSLLLDGREKAQLKGSRFSVGAFQGGGIGARHSSGYTVMPEDSAIDREAQRASLLRSNEGNRQSYVEDAGGAMLPNAVELLRFRCESTMALLPKIFIPAVPPLGADTRSNCGEATVDQAQRSSWECPDDNVPATTTATAATTVDETESKKEETGNSSEYDLASAVYAAAEKVLKDKEWERPTSLYVPGKSGGVHDYDTSNPRRSRALNSDMRVSSGHLLFGSSEADKIDEEDEEYEETSDLDVENAINQLAPTKRASQAHSSLGESRGSVNDFIHGIDFFGAEGANGPELTGMLSADPDKLVFGVSLTSELATVHSPATGPSDLADDAAATDRNERSERVASGSTACQPEDSSVLFRPSWATGHKQQPLSSILRRSISMPGGTTSSGAPESSPSTPQADAYSPGSTVARSAFETGSKTLVRKHRKLKDDGLPMSPQSLISAVSSSSPLGSTSRVGMLKTIGHRFTSWFTKK